MNHVILLHLLKLLFMQLDGLIKLPELVLQPNAVLLNKFWKLLNVYWVNLFKGNSLLTLTSISNLRTCFIFIIAFAGLIHRIHKWRTRGKKLVPSHESEALEDKQKLQMKTFSELAECLARIPPKITLYGLLFKYNYVGCLMLLIFSNDLLFAMKRDAYIFKETG